MPTDIPLQPSTASSCRRGFVRSCLGWTIGSGVLLTGCTHRWLQPAQESPPQRWSGRMALRWKHEVDQAQFDSFSASFELEGSAQQGFLTLSTSLGVTLARLLWRPGAAQLQAQGQVKDYDSLQSLIQNLTHTPVPVQSLFDWLQGRTDAAESDTGWLPDVSQLGQGRLSAQRVSPWPEAHLRVTLDPS